MTTTDKTKDGKAIQVTDPATGEVQVLDNVGLPSAADYGLEFRVSDLLPTPEAWAEYPQVNFMDWTERDLILMGVMIFPSQDYEDREWAIILFRDPISNDVLTTAKGGSVLVPRLRRLAEMKRPDGKVGAFPIVGRFVEKESKVRGHEPYFDLL